MAGGARGWVAGRAGFWGALATWVSSFSPKVPEHPASTCDEALNKVKYTYLT